HMNPTATVVVGDVEGNKSFVWIRNIRYVVFERIHYDAVAVGIVLVIGTPALSQRVVMRHIKVDHVAERLSIGQVHATWCIPWYRAGDHDSNAGALRVAGHARIIVDGIVQDIVILSHAAIDTGLAISMDDVVEQPHMMGRCGAREISHITKSNPHA